MRFSDVQLKAGGFTGTDSAKYAGPAQFSVSFPIFLIVEAWRAGVEFGDLADGPPSIRVPLGARVHWSEIRDSSTEAITEMFQRSLNHFFGKD